MEQTEKKRLNNQEELIIEALKNHGQLTNVQICNYCKCMNFTARISGLRKKGFNVVLVKRNHGGAGVNLYQLEEYKEAKQGNLF